MVLAVTAEGNEIFQHFGHTKMFKLFTVEDGKVVSRSDLDTSMSGHEALAVILRQNGVSLLICGGIGGGAKMALQAAGIRMTRLCSAVITITVKRAVTPAGITRAVIAVTTNKKDKKTPARLRRCFFH